MAVPADVLPSSSAPIRVDSSIFRDGRRAQANDVFIAVMGLTGSGKSTFISHLTKSTVKIGNKLQSCTREVGVYHYQYNEITNVYLVDTPGFDDTELSDTDILKEIATWLTGSYNNQVKLTGILYLHRITDQRMTGSAMKNLFMFKKLCGPDALKHVVLVTTMWELVSETTGKDRQVELETTEEFWGYMLQKGSRIEQHMNTPESARRIVQLLMASESRPSSPLLLAIQDEMVNNNKDLDETEAGKGLDGVLAKERERFRQELEQARQDMKEAIDMRDRESQEELAKQQEKAARKMELFERQQEELKINMERLHREKYEALEADMSRHRMEIETRNKEKYAALEADMSRHRMETESRNQEREAEWHKQREELTGQVTSLTTRIKKGVGHQLGQSLEIPDIPAWGRTISLTLRGSEWAFLGPHSKTWDVKEEMKNEIIPLLKRSGDAPRLKRFVMGEADSSYFAHYHTGFFFTRCHYYGRVKDSYPGLFEFLNSNKGTECPKCISLGPQGSYFISTEKRSSYKLHPNGPTAEQAASASRLWWGFDGAYVMEVKNKPLQFDLRGHYSGLDARLENRSDESRIQELAMDIQGGEAWAVIFEVGPGAFKSQIVDQDSGWDQPFQEFTAKNFGFTWAT